MAGTKYYANIEKKAPLTDTFNQKGQSNQANLRSAFSASPIIGDPDDGEILSAEERIELYQELVMDGVTLNGNGFAEFDPNYIDAPNIKTIDINDDAALGEKLPSPYVPNPTSPGETLDAADKPDFEGEIRDPNTINQFGSGNKSTYNPVKSSKQIAAQKIGDYLLGDSGGN